jgi:UDP-glucose 4-epimerase
MPDSTRRPVDARGTACYRRPVRLSDGPRRLLVTGVAGFLGGALAELASTRGLVVAGCDRVPAAGSSSLSSFTECELSPGALDALVRDFQPDFCVHFAGRASVPESVRDPVGDFQAGALPTIATLDSLRRLAPGCRFILASSAAVYGAPESLPITEQHMPRPVSPYGFHKLICEQLCREYHTLYGLRTASVRIFSAYGEGLRKQVVWDILEKVARGPALQLQGSSEASRDFIHARDVAEAILLVLERGELEGGAYNVASGRESSIAELARLICHALGAQVEVSFDGIVPPGTPLRWRADIALLSGLGFSPKVSLERGVEAVTAWWRTLRA